MSLKPSLSALSRLAGEVEVPHYARDALTPGIVHIGVGNFHRAHQAYYLHRLFNANTDLDWAIIGAGVKPYDAAMREKLKAQDWLTTIVELDPDGYRAMVTGAMIDFAPVDHASLIETLCRPEIRIVSLTVTEGGYYVDARTGGFDGGNEDIRRDIADPDNPQTVFGIIIAALERRRADGVTPFAVMSCDNLPENGHVTRQAILGLARELPGDIGDWISANVVFPNSMVDCITPATGDRERALVREKFGIDDAAPVVCEPFRQWVMEDNFPAGRPALERVGVEFVKDVAPYELMKLRILNGGHAAIAYPSALLGIHFVHDAMANPLVSSFLDCLEHAEIMPTVPAIPGVDFEDYFRKVAERFSNEAVGDTIPRLCLDGSNRQPKFILPTIRDRLAAGLPIDGLALEVALWCRFCAGTDDAGEAIEIPDEKAAQLNEHALQARGEPAAFLRQSEIFGDLAENETFVRAFASALDRLWQDGVAACLEAYCASTRQ
jgi:mannitol 2-dehydrogenase